MVAGVAMPGRVAIHHQGPVAHDGFMLKLRVEGETFVEASFGLETDDQD